MERVEIIYCLRVLVSTLRGRFDYVTLRFCGLLLSFVGDYTITLSAVVAMLVHPHDSTIGKKYHSASTKATCMLNMAVAPLLINKLVFTMRSHPFSLSTDGSNDSGIENMNPMSIRVFDEERSKVITKFLHMCPSVDGRAETVFYY